MRVKCWKNISRSKFSICVSSVQDRSNKGRSTILQAIDRSHRMRNFLHLYSLLLVHGHSRDRKTVGVCRQPSKQLLHRSFALVPFFFSSFSFSPLFQNLSETIKKRSSKTADPLSRRTQRAGVGQTKGWGVTGRLLHNRKEMCNTRILHPPLRVISRIQRCADKMCSFIESCLRNFARLLPSFYADFTRSSVEQSFFL